MSATSNCNGRLVHKFFAGLAAYALALQLLLPTLALAQVVSTRPLQHVLCTSGSTIDRPAPAPVDHLQICPCGPLCAMQEFGASAGAVPASYAVAWVAVATAYLYPPHLPPDRLSGDPGSTPHNPRAPPVA